MRNACRRDPIVCGSVARYHRSLALPNATSDPEQALQETDTGGDGAPRSKPLTTISVPQLTDRVRKVRQARSEVMEEDVHYGTIPGTGDKPTLLKPGAEILCSLFQLAPDPSLEIKQLEGEHREYIVRGGLRHIPSGNKVGSGYGSCSTKESKYRYRYIEDATDVGVPNSFWDSGEEMSDRDFSLLRDALESEAVPIPEDAEAGVTKEQGQWLVTVEGKGENPDLADVYNTCLKMAKKRWLVDVTLTATAASEIFTQDLDDLEDLRGTDVGNSPSGQHRAAANNRKPAAAWTAPAGDTFEGVHPKAKQKLNEWDEKLNAVGGADLAARVEAIRESVSWNGTEATALSRLLSDHEQRLADKESKRPESGKRQFSSHEQAIKVMCPIALKWGQREDPPPTERRISSEKESEEDTTQLGRLFRIADQNGWKDSWLDRLVKDELGFESKTHIPYGDPYDEICAALRNDEMRFWMSRDPDTLDMEFEESADDGEANHPEFEDDSDLPF